MQSAPRAGLPHLSSRGRLRLWVRISTLIRRGRLNFLPLFTPAKWLICYLLSKGRTAGFGQRQEASAQNGRQAAEPCGQKMQTPSLSPICREKTSVMTELCTFIERGASVINTRDAGSGFCSNPPPARCGAPRTWLSLPDLDPWPASEEGGKRPRCKM